MEHRDFDCDTRIVLGGLRRALQVLDRPRAVAFEELEPHEADKRVVVLGVLGKNLLVSRPRLLDVAIARIERSHHVEQARAALGRDKVDRAADLVQRLARTAGLRPRKAKTDEYLGIPDVAVNVGKLPEDIATLPVFDNGLELLLDVVLLAHRLRMAGARHLELVEKRANVVPVDGVEDELVHVERAVVVAGVLKPHAAVIGNKADVAA